MRVLLVRPFYHLERFYFPRLIPEPLGLEYLASFIRETTAHEVCIFDAIGERWNEYSVLAHEPQLIRKGASLASIRKVVQEYDPAAVGITSLFSAQKDSLSLVANLVKGINRKIIVFAGGPHPSTEPRAVLTDNQSMDLVVIGEGESTVKELLDSDFKELSSVDGIAFRDGNQIVLNKPRELIKNLDEIPFPARDLVPFANYSKQRFQEALDSRFLKIGIDPLDSAIARTIARKVAGLPLLDRLYYYTHNRKNRSSSGLLPAGDIITSRGCPNKCSFCAIHNVWGHRYRMRSASDVLKEITLLVNRFHVRHIRIQDDNLTVSRRRTISICQGIVEQNLNITLEAPSGVFVPSLDEEVLSWLQRAGFISLSFGIESGNQEVLNTIIRKRLRLDQVEETIQICKKLGLYTVGFFMIGIPGETIETMYDTINFALESDLDRVRLYIYQPYPNTPLYEVCTEKGYLTEDYDPRKTLVTSDRCFIKTDEFSPTDIIHLAVEARQKLSKVGKG